MKRLQNGFSVVVSISLLGLVGFQGYQQWQRNQADRPDYDNPAPSPRTTLLSSPEQSEEWQVVRVSDGDSIVVRSGGREERVRFCGIDAPEAAQPWGAEATTYLQQLIDAAGGRVLLMQTDRDRYGRMVAEVFTLLPTGEKSLQEEMLLAGMAYVYPQYVDSCPNPEPMKLAEAIAQEEGLGVWSGEYQRPWEFRQMNR
ncbi:thermonuclease family protein [Egbenema bharatensis]|uniref:thermonuclease family protein n=1 Tax=Egbenema bharatensis TaxID=3463334 RepID=UPI003A8A6446